MKRKIICIIFFVMVSMTTFLTSNVMAAESAKCFGNSSLMSSNVNVGLANTGFSKLNYSVTNNIGQITRAQILSWINNTGNGYGFYINTHGLYLANEYFFTDYSGQLIGTDDISGNWHLVFLDCCRSGNTNAFANAFKINGYSNRAYLGWDGDVVEADATKFCRYFWSTYVTTTSIKQASVNAAANVPRNIFYPGQVLG